MTTTSPSPSRGFDFDAWLDTGTVAQTTVHRYNDGAARIAYKEAAALLRTYQEDKARRAAAGAHVEHAITDPNLQETIGADHLEVSIMDVITSEEIELQAAADEAWQALEASMETWTIRALNDEEIAHLRRTFPAPEAPKAPGKGAKAPTKARYTKALQEWSDTALERRDLANAALVSACTLAVATTGGENRAAGEYGTDTYLPAVTVEQAQRLQRVDPDGFTRLLNAAVNVRREDGEVEAPFWRPTDSGAVPA